MNSTVSERRASVRFDMAFPVYVSGDEGISRGIARNISEGGMFIETSQPCRIGSKVEVTFVSPVTREELTLSAKVRYLCYLSFGEEAEEGKGTLRGMGLRFTEQPGMEDDILTGGCEEQRCGAPAGFANAHFVN